MNAVTTLSITLAVRKRTSTYIIGNIILLCIVCIIRHYTIQIKCIYIYLLFHSAYHVLLLCGNNMGPRYRNPTAAEVCCRDFIVSQRRLYNLYGYYNIQNTHIHSNAVTYDKIKLYHEYTYLHNLI